MTVFLSQYLKLTDVISRPIDDMNATECKVKNGYNDDYRHDALKAMRDLNVPCDEAGDSVHELSVCWTFHSSLKESICRAFCSEHARIEA